MEKRSLLIDALRQKDMLTENGMPTNSSSLNPHVDLFFVIGAMRREMKDVSGRERLIRMFDAAYSNDPLLAARIAFWARNIRGGAGEREVFRVIMNYLAKNRKSAAIKNIQFIPEFGRWDDLFVFLNTPFEKEAISVYANALRNKNGLAAKWAPRLGGKVSKDKKLFANKLRAFMGLDPKSYRKMLVELTNVIETAMCNKDFGSIDFEKVPSLAYARYTKAFMKNDGERFQKFIESLEKGEATVNVGAIYPYDVIKTLKTTNSNSAVEQWKRLPDFLEGSEEKMLCVVDTSGSMNRSVNDTGSVNVMDVALSLGLYLSERMKGIFKDSFITFSGSPTLQYLTGDLRSRLIQLKKADWGFNTNISAVFNLVLNKAVKHKIPASEMPTKILILSDMEFDSCADNKDDSAMEMIERKYAEAGYERPDIIFWNLASRSGQVPVRFDKNGVALISGFSPAIVKNVLGGEVNPVKIMLKAVGAPVYDVIEV